MIKLRLKAIVPRADFRKNEETLYNEFLISTNFPGVLKKGETFLFLSRSGNQLLWFFEKVRQIEGHQGTIREVIDSRKWRLTGGVWHPYMLANYAEMVGIDLIGIKRFEEIIHEHSRRKRK